MCFLRRRKKNKYIFLKTNYFPSSRLTLGICKNFGPRIFPLCNYCTNDVCLRVFFVLYSFIRLWQSYCNNNIFIIYDLILFYITQFSRQFLWLKQKKNVPCAHISPSACVYIPYDLNARKAMYVYSIYINLRFGSCCVCIFRVVY